MRNIINTLTTIPVNDGNYTYALTRYAAADELKQAIEIMERSSKGNKGRIAACKKELRRRKMCEYCDPNTPSSIGFPKFKTTISHILSRLKASIS